MTTTYATDNTYGTNDVRPTPGAPAVYRARWIDAGDYAAADVVPDRQGFAYNDANDRDTLAALLEHARANTLHQQLERGTVTRVSNDPAWRLWMRRDGGYVYVTAWTMPDLEAATWHVECPDGVTRHAEPFATRAAAEQFAEWGHACCTGHRVWSRSSLPSR